MKFKRIREGRYVGLGSGLELIRGLDDSDGYDRTEWTIWTIDGGRCLGVTPTLNEAKTRARELYRTARYEVPR